MNPTRRYRQIQIQVAQWLSGQAGRPGCRIDTKQNGSAREGWFYIAHIDTPSHVCIINVNTPTFAPYRHICIEALSLANGQTRHCWHDGGRNPDNHEILAQLQQLAELIFR
ncbi:hypothetical protein H9Q10_00720 [Eikenella sp. S3360]|uniref:Uncharacterized protein n=1 Tax=Eikenella glucosivorans TaxID=2766967 RepID=A0ABS0N7B5_9NEIS|nr:hypothetical protein [Eikenella glucosivorans]MBH5328196.1 hypothetical protein [Eikenella glucosivorans]